MCLFSPSLQHKCQSWFPLNWLQKAYDTYNQQHRNYWRGHSTSCSLPFRVFKSVAETSLYRELLEEHAACTFFPETKQPQNQTTTRFSTQRTPSFGGSGVTCLVQSGEPQRGSILVEYLLWNCFSLRFAILYKFLFKKTLGRNISLKSVAGMAIFSHIVTGLFLTSEYCDSCQNQAQDPHWGKCTG